MTKNERIAALENEVDALRLEIAALRTELRRIQSPIFYPLDYGWWWSRPTYPTLPPVTTSPDTTGQPLTQWPLKVTCLSSDTAP